MLAAWALLILANFPLAAPYPGGHRSRLAALRETWAGAWRDHQPPAAADPAGLIANWSRHAAAAALALGIVAGLAGWGGAVLRFCRAAGPAPAGARWAAGLVAAGLATLGAGFAGLVYPPLLLAGAAAGAVMWARGRIRASPARVPAGADRPVWLRRSERVVAGWWVLAALVPEPGIDAYVYHLRLPFYYQLHHRIFSVWHHIHGHVPQLWELQLTAVPPGLADTVAQMLSALTVIPVWRSIVRLGGGGVPARAAALALVTSPLVIGVGASAYTDLPLLMLGLGSFAALCEGDGFGRASRRFAAGALLGAACSLKYAAFPLVAAQAVWLGREAVRRRRPGLPLPALAGFLAVFAPWMAWNYFGTGNPFDPFLARWFPEALPALPFADRLSASVFRRPARDVLAAVWNGYVACEPYLFVAPWLLAAAPAALWLARPAGWRGAGLWLGVYAAVWSWMIADERFGLAALAVLAALLAASGRAPRAPAFWIAVLAFNLGASACQEFLPWPRLRTVLGLEAHEVYVRAALPPSPAYGQAADWLNGATGSRDRILFVSESRTHLIRRECVADHVIDYPTRLVYLLQRTPADPSRIAARFRQLGIRWVLYLPGRCAARLADMPDLFEFTPAIARAWERFWLERATRTWTAPGASVYALADKAAARPPAAVPELPGIQDVMFVSIDQTYRREGPEAALAELRKYAEGYPRIGAVRRRLGEALIAMRRDPDSLAEARRHLSFAAAADRAVHR